MWLEAVNASLIFHESGFGPGMTEGAGATEWRREEAGGVSISPGMRIQRAKVVGQSYSHSSAELQAADTTLQRLLCEEP